MRTRQTDTTTHAPQRLLRPQEVCDLLGVTMHAVEAWRRRGGGPEFVRVGRLIRYRQSAIEQYIQARTRSTTKLRVGVAASR